MRDFYQLFVDLLNDVYSAEKQLGAALPAIIRGAHDDALKGILQQHHAQIKIQVKRLENIADELHEKLGELECEGMKGLLHECKQVLHRNYAKDVHDAALITEIQKIKHYEISLYGALKAFAKQLQLKNVLELLKESSKEEGDADHELTKIADGTLFITGVNPKALKRKTA
jgi:ferritin-like metal-binding protein YciE